MTGRDEPRPLRIPEVWGKPKGLLALGDDWAMFRCIARGAAEDGIDGKGWGAEMKVGMRSPLGVRAIIGDSATKMVGRFKPPSDCTGDLGTDTKALRA